MTALIVIALVLICVLAVRSYVGKIAHGCCGAGGDAEKRIAKAADLSRFRYRYKIKIGGMTCKNCALRIENTLNRQDGIYAKVDFKSGLCEVSSDSPVSELLLRQTVVGLGYSVEEIEKIEPNEADA